MSKLKWKNLKIFKCPECSSGIEPNDRGYRCVDCDFFITEERFDSLTGDIDREDFKKDMEGFGFD